MIQFRKSKKFGPFRLTATTRGLSLSGGVPGARVSVNSRGEVRRTLGVPGTGVYDVKKIDTLGDAGEPGRTSSARAAGGAGEGAAPAADGVIELPLTGGVIEVPEGVTRIQVLPIDVKRGVSRGWVVATIVLALALAAVMLGR